MSSAVRVRTALILLPGFLAVLVFGGEVLFAFLLAAAAAVGAREYQNIASPGTAGREAWFVPLWSAGVVLAFLTPRSSGTVSAALALGCLIYFAGWILGPGPRADTLPRLGAALGAWVLVAVFLGHGVWIRAHGVGPILFLAVVVWVGDTAAYYVGSSLGKRRLAPAVSPKKSVEGAVASAVGSAAAAAALSLAVSLPHSLWPSVGLGLLINVAAQLGDLAESLLKRCAGVKDSGTLFPGHGGVLDRLDGFLLSLPLYAFFLGPAGG